MEKDNDFLQNLSESKPTVEENNENLSEKTPEEPPKKTVPEPEEDRNAYVYRWTYGEQDLYDRHRRREERKHGKWVYALTMLLAFTVGFGALFGVLWVNGRLPVTGSWFNFEKTTEDIAQDAFPATVLIYNSEVKGYGTGFFVTPDGYLVTNYHVVQSADKVGVTLYDSTVLEGKVIGYSSVDDVAVVKVEGKSFDTVSIGNSSNVKAGERVIAVGNAGGDICSWTVTEGILSASDRRMTSTYSTFILETTLLQTDAALNHGNSGGMLLDGNGKVIGITSSKVTDSSVQDAEGLGFAIPINGAMKIVNALIEKGTCANVKSGNTRIRPLIGISGSTIAKGEEFSKQSAGGQVETFRATRDGVRVATVTVGGAADGQLEPGDIIYEIDGKTVTVMKDLTEALYGYDLGATIRLKVDRFGTLLDVKVTIGTLQ